MTEQLQPSAGGCQGVVYQQHGCCTSNMAAACPPLPPCHTPLLHHHASSCDSVALTLVRPGHTVSHFLHETAAKAQFCVQLDVRHVSQWNVPPRHGRRHASPSMVSGSPISHTVYTPRHPAAASHTETPHSPLTFPTCMPQNYAAVTSPSMVGLTSCTFRTPRPMSHLSHCHSFSHTRHTSSLSHFSHLYVPVVH